jgi:eukaryotic-like serine/threonine-protein kinase
LPAGYRHILRLKPRGVVTVNLDVLTGQALTEVRPNDQQMPIYGREVAGRLDVIQSADPFLIYLHGHISDANSWILDYDDLKRSQENEGHQDFLKYMYSYCRVLFYGISADDISMSGKLIESRGAGLRPPSLFWLTNRHDPKLLDWANENYIRVIAYKASPSHDEVLNAFVEDCLTFTSIDAPPPLVQHTKTFSSNLEMSPDAVAALQPEEIRKFLNDKISYLLEHAPLSDHYNLLQEFLREYSRAVHNSYFFSDKEPYNIWFNTRLEFPPLGDGTFGQVFLAKESNAEIAVKIMRESIHNKADMLGAFRRGVQSMIIITKAGIPGMVRYRDAYEVPPTILMDFISGASLEMAVRTGIQTSWLTKIRIIKAVAYIVRQAHLLPETVLHRDLKPSNIMLKDYAYEKTFDPDVVVLDFDMSWHKDSLEKDVLFEARDDFAYLAPEQVDSNKLSLSRSTLVDAYGLGMTAFYLFGSKHPQINAYLAPEWYDAIYQACRAGYSEPWSSAPARLSRLIQACTSDAQSSRPDFGQIISELENIETSVLDYTKLDDAGIFAEELMAQTAGTNRYSVDLRSMRYHYTNPTGVNTEAYCDVRRVKIIYTISWLDQGHVERRQINKFVDTAAERCSAIIFRSPWQLKSRDPRQNGVSISVEMPLEMAKNKWPEALKAVRDVQAEFNFA